MIWLQSSRTKDLRLGSHDFYDLQMNNSLVQSTPININQNDDAEIRGVIVFTGLKVTQKYSSVDLEENRIQEEQ
jgi:hypothetical protein